MLLRIARVILTLLLALLVLSRSTVPPGKVIDRARVFTRDIEFDFVGWMLETLGLKVSQAALGSENYLAESDRTREVLAYRDLIENIQHKEAELARMYADPEVTDPETASQSLRAELDGLYASREQIAPLAEAVIQDQVTEAVADFGLTLGGQPIPPVLYHSTSLPSALIISPRELIRQDADISLKPGLTVDEKAALEEQVDNKLNVSSLVVGIGGVGVYPTMVDQTSDLNWLVSTVAHEWVHNFLTLRPLGISYMNSPELRTMNETTASIAGKEIGRAIIEKYYPQFLPPEEEPGQPAAPSATQQPPVFNFQRAMHETRVTVDKLLAMGDVEEAEKYMEYRRVYMWENGYQIRKLNQAYFAFYGAYADQPGGAAGEDPVGAAVRALRARSRSLGDFIHRIAWMSSFQQLLNAVEEP